MKRTRLSALAFLSTTILTGALNAQVIVPCGGSFDSFKSNMRQAGINAGVPAAAVDAVLANSRVLQDVLKLDRSQATFKQTFLEFSGRTVSSSRLKIGRQKLGEYANVFAKAKSQYGVSPEVITTFWAMETDFGAVQGNTNTVSALATLAHDCRRPELFQPQYLGAMRLTAKGGMDPASTTGAWAGEIGMVQMLPDDIVRLGVDGNGDGQVNLKTTPEDAILSAAKMLNSHGWRAGQPWVQEVKVAGDQAWQHSGLDQKLTTEQWAGLGVSGRNSGLPKGLRASLVAPQGRFGPLFLTYENYDVFLQWNKSFIYSLSAAYMATRFAGAPALTSGNPTPALSVDQVKQLQQKLQARGHDVGKIDGIIGSMTRNAVRDIQKSSGQVPDGWPSAEFLNSL